MSELHRPDVAVSVPLPPRPPMAVVFVPGPPEDHLPTVVSLRRAQPDIPILVGGPEPAMLTVLARDGVSIGRAVSLADLVTHARRLGAGHVLAVSSPIIFPSAALSPGLDIIDHRLSVATVSFLSNAAAHLSFPNPGLPVAHQPEGLDEELITLRLRRAGPEQLPVPVPFAMGPATLLSEYALSAVAGLDETAPNAQAALADFSLRARRRGFVDVLDPSTYCARLFDGSGRHDGHAELTEGDRRWLVGRHPVVPVAERQALSTESALTIAQATARAKVLGVRVLVDGSCLGQRQMGTQIQTVALVDALARSGDIERVSVALATDIPAYATAALRHPKVHARLAALGDVSVFGPVDVVHRPFQPDGPVDVDSWRRVGRRTVLTVLDLIAYRAPMYHRSLDGWSSYRQALEAAVMKVDAVVTPAVDVALQLQMERLPLERDRLLTATLGTDHLGGNEAASIPPTLLDRGYAAGQFLLVMGANYAHKNRDIAIGVLDDLRRRGFDLALVAAGATVPFGSSRALEAAAADQGEVFTLPDLRAEERNWLLRHASLVLYPTSAEGFGLVPSEAARFGTPTVFVPLGPLAELYRGLPVTARDWSAGSMADAAERLLLDPRLARAQVRAVLDASADYTWDAAAARLVRIYRSILALPPRTERPADP